MRKRKTFKQFVALIMALFIIVSLIPSSAVNAEDIATGTDAEYNDETDDKPSVEISDSSDTEDISTTEETSEEVRKEEEKVSQEEDEEKIEVTDSNLSEDDTDEEDFFIVFDHLYSDVNTTCINTSKLFVEASDPTVFTRNTTVESNYENIYIISFSSVEEARYAYSYYIDKVSFITDLSNAVTLAENESSESEEDIADLSGVNEGSDAIANLNDISARNYSGYIALIDSGANADVNLDVTGTGVSDNVGHGSRMLQFIREENPDAKVLSIKAFNGRSANVADVYAAIKLAIESKVSVINLSFVAVDNEYNEILRAVIQEALNNGITVIGAVGNYSSSAKNFISGCLGGVISVGAVNDDGTLYKTSNYNADLYVVAESTSEASARYSGIYTSGKASDKVYKKLIDSSDNNSDEEISEDDVALQYDENSSWADVLNENYGFNVTKTTRPDWAPLSISASGLTIKVGADRTNYQGSIYSFGTLTYIGGTAGKAGTILYGADNPGVYHTSCYDHHMTPSINRPVPPEGNHTIDIILEYAGVDSNGYVYYANVYNGYVPTYQREFVYICIERRPWRRYIKVKKVGVKDEAVTCCDIDIYNSSGTTKIGDMKDNGDGTYSWWSDWMTTDAYQQIAIKEVKGGGIYNNAYNNNKWLHSDGTLSNTVEAISTSYEYKGEELASYPIKFSGKQTFKTFLYLQKSSANTSYTDGNPNYSLAGAEYKVFKSSAEAQASISSRDFSKAFATITTDASGKTSTIDVTSQMDTYSDGTIKETAFYVIESKAPKNYKMDNGVHPVTVTTANTDDNPAKVSVSDGPIDDPIEIQILKEHPEDDIPLEGAEFTLKYYAQDITRNYTFSQLQQFTVNQTKTYTTNSEGIVTINDYFPLGYITLEETKAPVGFINSSTDKATIDGKDVSPKMAFVLTGVGNTTTGYTTGGAYYINDSGVRDIKMSTDTTVYNKAVNPNEHGRGDIRLIKHRHKSDVPLAGAEFEIKNTETNESVTLTTDENGIIDTSAKYKSHSEGVWFKLGAQGTSEKTPDDTKGALPFGIYTVTEINAPEGYQKEETITVNIKNDGEIITVYDNARTDNLEVISDMETAKIGTQALVETPHGETKVLPAAPGQTIHDICEYSGLKYGQEYTLIGRLMEKADDGSVKPFMTKDDEGNEVEATGITYFRTGSTYTYSRYDSEGTETVEFANLDFTGKEGTSFVVYERLYLGHVTEEDIESGNYDKNYADSNNTTEFPIIHENPDDLNQTVKTPKGETDANTEDETKTVSSASKHFIINDTVKYEGLEVGRTYRLDGQLYIRPNNDSDDKEYTDAELEKLRVKDKDGSFVTATTTFVPETESGTTVVTFEYDLEYEIEKRTYVVFEDCYDIEDGNVKMFAHADIHDDRQSFYQPVISTQAKGTEGRSELCYTEGKFIDTIKYENLEANTRYTVEGVAMDKATGKELLLNGKTVKAAATFTTGASTNPNGAVDGEYDLEFKISEDQQNDLKGKTIVIYETLKNQAGTIIAEHKDISDKDQELTVPDLKTTLLGEKTKEHIVFPDEITTLIDTCTYTNLIPGKEYAINGTLMNKVKNEPLLDENGNKITGSTNFTADKSGSGVVEVKFTFNAKILKIEGESIVAFEKVLPTDGSIPVGTHMDINDEDQTVRIPKVGTKVSKSSWTSKETISLTDSISYSNLATDKKYKAKGWLVDKDGNKVIVDGNQIYKEVEFTPSSENGMIDVKFEDFSAESLSGKYVVFEEVYLVKEDGSESEVGEHKDLTDSNQTITVTKIPKVPKTGDTVPIIPIITIMLAAFAGIAAIVTIKKNKKNDK